MRRDQQVGAERSRPPTGEARAARGVEGRRHLVRLARRGYDLLKGTRLEPLLRLPPLDVLRRRLVTIGADDVVRVTTALSEAGVQSWVAGGWAVDALCGRQTRRHGDLDVMVPLDELDRAGARLQRLGYALMLDQDFGSGHWMPRRLLFRDPLGKSVDVHPVRVTSGVLRAVNGPEQLVMTWEQATAVGRLGGTPVVCLSAEAQLAAKRGHAWDEQDLRDAAVLEPLTGSPVPASSDGSRRPRRRGRSRLGRVARLGRPTALYVPVPSGRRLVETARALGARGVSPGLPPHVTVLYPFLPGHRVGPREQRHLGRLARGVPAFDLRLGSLARFAQGVLYVEPEPADPFLRLVEAVRRQWPGVEPYGGAFDEVVPHVTVSNGPEPDGLGAALEPLLPVEATVEVLALAWRDWRGRWRTLAEYPLGDDVDGQGGGPGRRDE